MILTMVITSLVVHNPLVMAANWGWQVHHLDVKTAFLDGELVEDVYVSQPEGFVIKGNEQLVLKLSKALYGLRQASELGM